MPSSCPRGKIIQVNVSSGGVPKLPIPRARVGALGVEGDTHRYHGHGGPRKALLLMSAEVIETLREEGFPVYFGALGENLTVQGLPCQKWQAGQRYRAGSVLLELTEPRVPCRKLRPFGKGIEKRILMAPGESGFYASVLEPGNIERGDDIEMVAATTKIQTCRAPVSGL